MVWFGSSTTNYKDILSDPEIDLVMISTRHNLHANQVVESLQAGKHVFVEKPLAITAEEINEIQTVYEKAGKTLTVGFNRRFSPFIRDAQKQLGHAGPLNIIATMNAGHIPAQHWTQDMHSGGGRIIGEACHYIDLMIALTGSLVHSVVMNALGPAMEENTDNVSILLRFQNGSQGVINYFSNGSKAYSKERIEVFSQNRTIVIDNFRKSEYFGFSASGMKKTQDKGHREQFRLFLQRLQDGGEAIIPFAEIINTSRAVIAAVESLKTGGWVSV